MPLYQKGGHTIDCPPIFRCREHKTPLSFSESFCDELMAYAEGHVPSSLTDTMRKHLGKRTGYLLPENLANPKIVLYNPENATGADALPFVTCRVNNRFVAIPARYLTANNFDGCQECASRQCRKPPPQEPFPPVGARPSRPPRPRGESQEMRRRGPRPGGGPESGRRMPPKDGKRPDSKRRPTTSRLDKASKSGIQKPISAKAAGKPPTGKPPTGKPPTQSANRPPSSRSTSAQRGPKPPVNKGPGKAAPGPKTKSGPQPSKPSGPPPGSGAKVRRKAPDSRPPRPEPKPSTPPQNEPQIEEIDGIQLRDHA